MRGSIVTARRGVGTFKRPNSMAKSQPSSPRGRWGPKPGPGDLRQSIETVPAEKRVDVVPGPGGKPPLFNPNVGGLVHDTIRRKMREVYRDFLSGESSKNWLFHVLTGDVCQMAFFAVGRLIAPHGIHDFQPLSAHSSDRLVIVVPLRSLFIVIGFRPL